jgi:hypothetical protein
MAACIPPLPRRIAIPVVVITTVWALFTVVVYLMIVYGSFVQLWGRDNTLTVKHYLTAFSLSFGQFGLQWSGSAWNSFWTTLQIATISAPLTAAIGLITAWLLTRQKFHGKRVFEFGTMLSFAIPGTVIGVSYIIAFNVPPIELTGTAAILVICFVFRNMPVGVRSGIASLSQIDKSLDEASLTLGARFLDHLPAHHAAADPPGDPVGTGVQLRAQHDGHQRGDLPGQRQTRHGHQLHHRSGGEQRIWCGDCLFHRPDRRDAGGHRLFQWLVGSDGWGGAACARIHP